jgi:hypothetical protein
VNAPFRLIPKILDIVEIQSAEATLIAPWWPYQMWHKKLINMAVAPPMRIPNNIRSIQFGQGAEPLKNRKWKLYARKMCGQSSSMNRDGGGQLRNAPLCVGRNRLSSPTIYSYSNLQGFVNQDTAVFRSEIEQL